MKWGQFLELFLIQETTRNQKSILLIKLFLSHSAREQTLALFSLSLKMFTVTTNKIYFVHQGFPLNKQQIIIIINLHQATFCKLTLRINFLTATSSHRTYLRGSKQTLHYSYHGYHILITKIINCRLRPRILLAQKQIKCMCLPYLLKIKQGIATSDCEIVCVQ